MRTPTKKTLAREAKIFNKKQRVRNEKGTCKICKKYSLFLIHNGFCSCITTDDDYKNHAVEMKGGRKIIAKKIDDFKIPQLKAKYKSLVREPGVVAKKSGIVYHKEYSGTKKLAFLRSHEWKAIRFEALTMYRKCLACGSEKDLQGDHIYPLCSHWDLRNDINNIQILCADCNWGKGTQIKDFRPLNDKGRMHLEDIMKDMKMRRIY